eukprot:tig00020734_g13577.t1
MPPKRAAAKAAAEKVSADTASKAKRKSAVMSARARPALAQQLRPLERLRRDKNIVTSLSFRHHEAEKKDKKKAKAEKPKKKEEESEESGVSEAEKAPKEKAPAAKKEKKAENKEEKEAAKPAGPATDGFDYYWARKNCEQCKKAEAFFSKHGIVHPAPEDATKVKKTKAQMVELVKRAKTLLGNKATKLVKEDVSKMSDSDITDVVAGPSGGLRAPFMLYKDFAVVGCKEEALKEAFGK